MLFLFDQKVINTQNSHAGVNGQIWPHCGWRGYEREEKEGEREVDNLSTCGCVIQLYLWENTRFIEIREFGWGFLMLTS